MNFKNAQTAISFITLLASLVLLSCGGGGGGGNPGGGGGGGGNPGGGGGSIPGSSSSSTQTGFPPCLLTVDRTQYDSSGADPLQDYQWYLDKAYVKDAWSKMPANMRGGTGVEIAIIDDAIQTNHEDLSANYIAGGGVNLDVDNTSDPYHNNPYPDSSCSDRHGTAVAGIAVARGDNGRGIKGIAYNAKFWGANYIAALVNLDVALAHRTDTTAVSINSWGPDYPTRLFPGRSILNSLDPAVLSAGNGGKGISYLFAAGNDGDNRRYGNRTEIPDTINMASYAEMVNHAGIIPVCSVNFADNVSSYSEAGPNVWICGYSNTGQRNSAVQFSRPADYILRNPANYYQHLINASFPTFKFFGLPSTDLSGTRGYNRVPPRFAAIYTASSNPPPRECSLFLTSRLDFGTQSYAQRNINCGRYSGVSNFNFTSTDVADPANRHFNWRSGVTNSYTRYFGGTSAATPLVGGIVALIRAANSNLTWREVKLILAESASQPPAFTSISGISPKYSRPPLAGASPNYEFDPSFGFGIVNASRAVEIANDWQASSFSLPNATFVMKPYEFLRVSQLNQDRSFIGTANFTFNATETAGLDFIEYVYLEIDDNSLPNFPVTLNSGDLRIELSSPAGITSVFAKPHTCLTKTRTRGSYTIAARNTCPAFRRAFLFGSAVHLGEPIRPQGSSVGNWTLTMTDTNRGGHIYNDIMGLQARLIFFGHKR